MKGSERSYIIHSYRHGAGGRVPAFESTLEIASLVESGLGILGMFLNVNVLNIWLAKRVDTAFRVSWVYCCRRIIPSPSRRRRLVLSQ